MVITQRAAIMSQSSQIAHCARSLAPRQSLSANPSEHGAHATRAKRPEIRCHLTAIGSAGTRASFRVPGGGSGPNSWSRSHGVARVAASCRLGAAPLVPAAQGPAAQGGRTRRSFVATQLVREQAASGRPVQLSAKGSNVEESEAEVSGGSETSSEGAGAGFGVGENPKSAVDVGTSAVLWLFWAGFIAYAALAAPNQTPYRDQYFVKKLLGLSGDDGFRMNQVLFCLWNVMGVIPLIYAQLLIPSARSKDGRPPVWPFATASAFVGAFALLPYFALWAPTTTDNVPSREERRRRPLRVLDSKITAALAALGAVGLAGGALAAGPGDWTEFFQYFRESKLVHVTSIDFAILTVFLPFFMILDMGVRKWSGREKWWLPFALVPLLGPAAYLLIRPPVPMPPDESES